MSADVAPFRLVSTPPNSFSAGGFRVLAGLLVGAAALGSVVFAMVGAWPVAGFLGVEVLLAAWLIARHAKRSAAAVEEVAIEDGRLTVRARDARGRETRAELDAYWARLERPGDGRVLLVSRQRRVEVGRFLSDEERDAFAAALSDALARHRSAV
jgi:uncharacterized membrane protein